MGLADGLHEMRSEESGCPDGAVLLEEEQDGESG